MQRPSPGRGRPQVDNAPMTTPDDVKARVASAYNSAADYYDHPANAFWDRFGGRTVERLRIAPGARVLDLCCGTGASALAAARAVGASGQVVAVDLAEELIRLGRGRARQLGLGNVDFRVADVLDLDLEPDSFDVVCCVFGVFFIPDMAGAVRRMWSFVRDGGRLAVTVWGSRLFEPVNTLFWDAIRRVRPELYKSFNPWDRLGETSLVRELFDEAGVLLAEVVL